MPHTKLQSSGKRSFTVVDAHHVDGCSTKFGNGSRFISRTPAGAARKALTGLCNRKNIKGQCSIYITLREMSQDSKHKEYQYKCRREKLKEPRMIGNHAVEYESKVHSSKSMPHCPKSRKSPGRMRSRSLRAHKRATTT
jgi:hypothetical protein